MPSAALRPRRIDSTWASLSRPFAIAPISRSNIPEDCRALSHEDGFGDIDASHVVLHRNPAAKGAAVNGMAAAMREAFSATQPALS